ncbi:MAG: UDP-2,3-diacylglucosamine diphosphatase [Proteobacteria bacterium]|nr:MAG: UDP-2,3-diacylglucosamine diphosphatase [Pseudomonadota bacterium]
MRAASARPTEDDYPRRPVFNRESTHASVLQRGNPRYRAIWISDTHLGTRGCNAPALLDFLRAHDSDILYLVGDIVDGWKLKRSWYWPQTHNDVVQKLLRKARKGTRVIYVPGNHDECFREYVGHSFGGIVLRKDVVHVTADGRRLLVMHGDEFDGVVRHAKWLARLGDIAYQAALNLNYVLNAARRGLGMPYWSVSAYLKLKVKNAVAFISNFEHAIVREARRRNLDGAVCGHIHHAAIRTIDGIAYYNDGDWVESCTALVEHYDGTMEIVRGDAPDVVRAMSFDRNPDNGRERRRATVKPTTTEC